MVVEVIVLVIGFGVCILFLAIWRIAMMEQRGVSVSLVDIAEAMEASSFTTGMSEVLTNAERGADCYEVVITSRMSQIQARQILAFFGSLSNKGYSPLKVLKGMACGDHSPRKHIRMS